MVERVRNVVMRVHKAGVTGTGRSGTLHEANGGLQLVASFRPDGEELEKLSSVLSSFHFICFFSSMRSTSIHLWKTTTACFGVLWQKMSTKCL